ncbi:MAG: hypothetical protein AAF490_13630 [Chloroflexota bacterium]
MSDNEGASFELTEKSFGYVIFYLAAYRLGIITAGIVSIYLGYRLFLSGLFPYAIEGSSFSAEVAGATFSLQSAAPGIFFALFGIIVIIVMILRSPPEFKFKSASGDEVAMRDASEIDWSNQPSTKKPTSGGEVAMSKNDHDGDIDWENEE